MKKRAGKTRYIYSGIFLLLFFALILLLKSFDVEKIGPLGTEVGLSHINGFFMNIFPFNSLFYDITEVFGIVAVLIMAIFFCLGAYQLFTGKKRGKRVDPEIMILGGLYVLTAILYVFFEKVIINQRPVIMPGETSPEASFPSSHTMLVFVVMGSAAILIGKYIRNNKLCLIIKIALESMIVLTILGRLFSGVHWFFDIVGGVLIGASLISLFHGMIDEVDAARKNI